MRDKGHKGNYSEALAFLPSHCLYLFELGHQRHFNRVDNTRACGTRNFSRPSTASTCRWIELCLGPWTRCACNMGSSKDAGVVRCAIDIKDGNTMSHAWRVFIKNGSTAPEEQLARIRSERQRVRSAKAKRVQRQDFWKQSKPVMLDHRGENKCGFMAASAFTMANTGNPHYGVDVRTWPTGTPLLSPGQV